jgi:hypothetical protein
MRSDSAEATMSARGERPLETTARASASALSAVLGAAARTCDPVDSIAGGTANKNSGTERLCARIRRGPGELVARRADDRARALGEEPIDGGCGLRRVCPFVFEGDAHVGDALEGELGAAEDAGSDGAARAREGQDEADDRDRRERG